MKRSTRLGIYSIGLGVWISGGLWLLFHYFLTKQGEFGPQTNPLESWWLKLHGLFAFGSLWLFGLLWGIHIKTAWPTRRKRWSGGIMTSILLLLCISGYLLYYVGEDSVRSVVSIIHWSVGLTIPGVFLWHRIKRRRVQNGTSVKRSVTYSS